MGNYTTIQGDMWDSISFKVYGSEAHTAVLIGANPEHAQTTIFGAGVTLSIPDLPPETSSTLPPWRTP